MIGVEPRPAHLSGGIWQSARMAATSGARGQRPNKHVERREATRAGLLELGAERFPVKGYASTTIDDIVRDSPYGRGAFYFHFTSKEEFFLEVLRARTEARPNWHEAARDPKLTTARAIVDASMARLAPQRTSSSPWPLLVSDFLSSLPGDSEFRKSFDEIRESWIEELTSWLDIVDERGFYRSRRPKREVAIAMLAVSDGFLFQRHQGHVDEGLYPVLVTYLLEDV